MFRFGIIGVGAVGELHKQALIAHPECKLTAICDLNQVKAVELAENTDSNIYSDYKEMQEKENLDAVIVNLPHYLHKDVSVYFLERKVAVLVEKPMAISVEECEDMITASKNNNTPIAIGHCQRYIPAIREAKKLVEEKRLGKLCSFTETRNTNYFNNRSEWFLDKKLSGGGIVINYGAHSLDKILYITGLEIEKVTAVGSNFLTEHNVEASAQLLMQLSGGASASVTYCGCRVPNCQDVALYFTDGVAELKEGELWISEGGAPYVKVDCSGVDVNFMKSQLIEFVKLLKGEENECATPEYGKTIISVLEKAFEQISI